MAYGFSASRLDYLRIARTRGEIQKATGIHWKTQEAVLAGTKTLSTEQRASLSNFYSRSTYKDFREQGWSVSQATRFRGYSPTTVLTKQIEYEDMLNNLSEKILINKHYKESISEIQGRLLTEKLGIKEAIRKATEQSDRSFEDWMSHDVS